MMYILISKYHKQPVVFFTNDLDEAKATLKKVARLIDAKAEIGHMGLDAYHPNKNHPFLYVIDPINAEELLNDALTAIEFDTLKK